MRFSEVRLVRACTHVSSTTQWSFDRHSRFLLRRFQESCVYSKAQRKVVAIVILTRMMGEMIGLAPPALWTITSSGIGLGLFIVPSHGFSCLSLSVRLERNNYRQTDERLICQFLIHLEIYSTNSWWFQSLLNVWVLYIKCWLIMAEGSSYQE